MNKCIAVLCALFCILNSSLSFAFDNGDWQIWSDQKVEASFNKDWKIWVEEEERFGDNVSALYYLHTEAGIWHGLTDWLSLGVNYRHISIKVHDKWKEEYMPNVYATVGWDLFGLKFDDRNRFEYRIHKHVRGSLRYRNRLTITAPLKWTALKMQPYVSNEIFIDSYRQKFDQNRLASGLKFNIIEHLDADVYYMWLAVESKSKWTSTNIVGLKVQVSF